MAPQQVTGSRGSSHTAWWPGGLEGTGPLPARAPGGKLRAQGVRGSPGHGAAACSAVCISVETTGLSHQRWDLGWGECRSSPPPPPTPPPGTAPSPARSRGSALGRPAPPSSACGFVRSVEDRRSSPSAWRPCRVGPEEAMRVPWPGSPSGWEELPQRVRHPHPVTSSSPGLRTGQR